MRTHPALLATLLAIGTLHAEPLTEADRQALIDQLDSLRGEAGEHASKRLQGAASDFAAAMRSEEAAMALYLKCVEKVDFEERDRSHTDFREWKRRNKDRLDDEGHALALRHQLRWTVLTMKAAASPAERRKLAPELLEALEAIYRTPNELRNHFGILTQSVGSTIFARAYGLTGYQIEDWPMSPLSGNGDGVKVAAPFEQVIFPAYRTAANYDALRAAWDRRIHFEEVTRGFWSRDSTEEGESPARETFLAEMRPQLDWDKEEDLFKAGDERKSAVTLLDHLKRHIGHSKARDWEARFRELVDPTAKPSTEQAGLDG